MGKLIPLKLFPQFSLDYEPKAVSELVLNNAIFVLDSVLHVMNISLPIQSLPPTIISLSTSHTCPTCFNNTNFIVLTTDIEYWAQIAYQFAHEMCHRVILNDVSQNLRWLEESICEMSSYYFLPKISKYWKRIAINKMTSDQKLYYPNFTSYVETDCQKAKAFDISRLCQTPQNELLKQLIENPYMRAENAHIANSMLPIFKEYPSTWHAIPYLAMLSSNQTFPDALKEWIKLAPPESRTGLQELAQLCGLSIPLSSF